MVTHNFSCEFDLNSGVMVIMLDSRVVDRAFESWSGQIKDNTISICCFSANTQH